MIDDGVCLSLDDAMITYAYNWYTLVHLNSAWKLFKSVFVCPHSPDELFAKFWDDIMPNITNYDIVRRYSMMAERMSQIENRRNSSLLPNDLDRKTGNSLYELIEESRRTASSDPNLLPLHSFCGDRIKKIRAEEHTRFGTNQGSFNRDSSCELRLMALSIQIQNLTDNTSLPKTNPLTMAQSIRSDFNVEEKSYGSQDSAGTSSIIGTNQSTMLEHDKMSRVSRDSTGQRTGALCELDVATMVDGSTCINEAEDLAFKARRSTDGEEKSLAERENNIF